MSTIELLFRMLNYLIVLAEINNTYINIYKSIVVKMSRFLIQAISEEDQGNSGNSQYG